MTPPAPGLATGSRVVRTRPWTYARRANAPLFEESAVAQETPATPDRDILIMTVTVWAAHLIIMTCATWLSGKAQGAGIVLSRVIVALSGVLINWLVYRVVRLRSIRTLAGRFLWTLAPSVPACLALVFVNEAVFLTLAPMPGPRSPIIEVIRSSAYDFAFFSWIFITWAALYAGLIYAYDLAANERRLTTAREEAHRAHLTALRLQLHPHFLFNALNTVAGLIALERSDVAERAVINLSDFLRNTLEPGFGEKIALGEELEIQSSYLEIEALRFSDRLKVAYDVEPEARAALVPSLILLPLVENVFKHAVSRSEDPIELAIGARRLADALELTVENRPTTAAHPAREGLGIGLSNIRRRLEALYGKAATFSAGPAPDGGGWRCVVTLPVE
jgi:hypothetical protein